MITPIRLNHLLLLLPITRPLTHHLLLQIHGSQTQLQRIILLLILLILMWIQVFIRAQIKYASEMVLVFPYSMLDPLTSAQTLANFFSQIFFMFPLFLAIFFLSVSFVVTPMHFLNFIPLSFFVKDACSQETILQGHVENDLYVFHAAAVPSSIFPQVFSTVRTSAQLWHARLGHPSSRTTSLMLQRFNLPLTTSTTLSPCSACSSSKAHALPHPTSLTHSCFTFQLMLMDVWGPASILSTKGSRNFLSIVYSKFIWYFPMQLKSNFTAIILLF